MPADRLTARAQDQSVKDRLLANTQFAHDQGAFGIPTFLVGEGMFFGKDRLADVEEILALEAACENAGHTRR